MQPGGNAPTSLNLGWETPDSVHVDFVYTGGWNAAAFQNDYFWNADAEL